MDVRLIPVDLDRDSEDLVSFLTSNRFPFHLVGEPDEAEARSRLTRGDFSPPERLAYWIESDASRVGILNFQDLSDDSPTIDLRLAEQSRGQGIGTLALGLGTSRIFTEHPDIRRIEGNTRTDNSAMRKVFERNHYVKEAHYREAWPVDGAEPVDAVGYGIIRRDWASGATTPIDWTV